MPIINKTFVFVYSLLLSMLSVYAETFKLNSQLTAGSLLPDGADNAAAAGIAVIIIPFFMIVFHLGLHAVIYEFSVRRHKGVPLYPRIVVLQSGSMLLNIVRLLGYGWLIYISFVSFRQDYPGWIYPISLLVNLNYWVWGLQMIKERINPTKL